MLNKDKDLLLMGNQFIWDEEIKRMQRVIAEVMKVLEKYAEKFPQEFNEVKVKRIFRELEILFNNFKNNKKVSSLKSFRNQKEIFKETDMNELYWREEVGQVKWKGVPYNIAQAMFYCEIFEIMGYWQEPTNPLLDPFIDLRYTIINDVLFEFTENKKRGFKLPLYINSIFYDSPNFEFLKDIRSTEKHKMLKRCLIFALKGNKLDLSVGDTIEKKSIELDEKDIAINDIDDIINHIISDKIKSIVLVLDNMGAEIIGILLFSCLYLRMFTEKEILLIAKKAPFFMNDVTKNDLIGYDVPEWWSIDKRDIRGLINTLGTSKYNPEDYQLSKQLFAFLRDELLSERRRFIIITHPFIESGNPFNEMPKSLKEKFCGETQMLFTFGEWINERINQGKSWPFGTSYEEAWGYLKEMNIVNYANFRVVKDLFSIVNPNKVNLKGRGNDAIVQFIKFL